MTVNSLHFKNIKGGRSIEELPYGLDTSRNFTYKIHQGFEPRQSVLGKIAEIFKKPFHRFYDRFDEKDNIYLAGPRAGMTNGPLDVHITQCSLKLGELVFLMIAKYAEQNDE